MKATIKIIEKFEKYLETLDKEPIKEFAKIEMEREETRRREMIKERQEDEVTVEKALGDRTTQDEG